MSVIKVLHLDHGTTWVERSLKREIDSGVAVEIVLLWRNEVFSDQICRYIISERGIRLAKEATPDVCDLVVIGNNLDTGLVYAEHIPEGMRSKTLVVWNRYSAGKGGYYERLGYRHFCSREAQPQHIAEILGLAR